MCRMIDAATWRRTSPSPFYVNQAPLFGPMFSVGLRDGALSLGIDARWVLETLAYESGLDPLRENGEYARGLWQRMPQRLYHAAAGEPAPAGCIVKAGWVQRLYATTDPVKQLSDAFAFWRAQIRDFRIPSFPTRAHWYCINLSPARLLDGRATQNTIIFPGGTPSYEANKNLDPLKPDGTRKGFVILADLDVPLEKAGKTYARRIQREIDAMPAGPPAPIAA
jgi:hypothetical protein